MTSRPRFADSHAKEVHDAGRAAFVSLLTSDPQPDEPATPAEPRPQRPAGAADQGVRGAAVGDSPRQAFADLIRSVL